jgi:Smg protein
MMKESESMFDVLMYLFENYMEEGSEFTPDHDSLVFELTEAGFPSGEVNKAFSWLEDLTNLRNNESELPESPGNESFRMYAPEEQQRLDPDSQGFIMFMEQSGVLDAVTRELVIDRVMALDLEEISLDQLKWVILMVLFNQPGQEHAHVLLEDIVFDEMEGHLN